MPFLPGDSLLFVVGAMCAVGLMSLPLVLVLLWLAAVLGNQCNYAIGKAIGPRVFQWEHSRWFNKRAFDQAHAFYERYGGVTIIAARFMPFLRTFAPFVAGVARMTRRRFTLFDVTGGALWIGLVTGAGYAFGKHSVGQGEPRQDHLGRDPDPRPARFHRGVAGPDEAGKGILTWRPAPALDAAPDWALDAACAAALAADSGSVPAAQACCW